MESRQPADKADSQGIAPCQFLEWDSQFFGYRIGSVRERRISKATVSEIDHWCKAEDIECLYFLADFDDPDTIRLAEESSFRLVDIRLTLRLTLSTTADSVPSAAAIRVGQLTDIPALRKIAQSSHTSSRFYFDSSFRKDRCDALYETWIEKSCRGEADVVFVPELEGKPAGYISCHLKPDQTGLIGLVGIAPEARGKKFGTEMIRAAQQWFVDKNVRQVSVVTQGRNVAAQRLYQRCGFCTESLQLWYHRWSSKA